MKIGRAISRTKNHALRWWAAHRSMTIRSGVGTGLKLNTRNASGNYIDGRNETPVQKALANCLRPGDIFYDIGANIGFFSVIAAKLVGPSGHVYAFEPVPQNAAGVQRNATLNQFRNITVFEKAVSSSTGTGKLLLAVHPGGAMLATTDGAITTDFNESILVDLVSIDALIAEQALPPPTVVKIDVEGAELEVLRGMSRTMEQFKPVIIYETDDKDLEPLEHKNKQIGGFLRAHGYHITTLEAAYPNSKWHVRHGVAVPHESRSR